MSAIFAEQPVFGTIQALFRIMLALPTPSTRKQAPSAPTRVTAARIALLQNELEMTGSLLLDALRLEREFSAYFATVNDPTSHAEQLAQWRECRRTIEQLTRDYTTIVLTWRESIANGCEE
jgi:hypothetical protein